MRHLVATSGYFQCITRANVTCVIDRRRKQLVDVTATCSPIPCARLLYVDVTNRHSGPGPTITSWSSHVIVEVGLLVTRLPVFCEFLSLAQVLGVWDPLELADRLTRGS